MPGRGETPLEEQGGSGSNNVDPPQKMIYFGRELFSVENKIFAIGKPWGLVCRSYKIAGDAVCVVGCRLPDGCQKSGVCGLPRLDQFGVRIYFFEDFSAKAIPTDGIRDF